MQIQIHHERMKKKVRYMIYKHDLMKSRSYKSKIVDIFSCPSAEAIVLASVLQITLCVCAHRHLWIFFTGIYFTQICSQVIIVCSPTAR